MEEIVLPNCCEPQLPKTRANLVKLHLVTDIITPQLHEQLAVSQLNVSATLTL